MTSCYFLFVLLWSFLRAHITYTCFIRSLMVISACTHHIYLDSFVPVHHTFRERHLLSRFLTVGNHIVRTWSMSRNQDQTDPVIFSTEPTITLKKWTATYHFEKSSKVVLQLPSKTKGFTDSYIPAGETENIPKTEIQRYKRKRWTSFDQFKDLQFVIWRLTLSNTESRWKNGFCN
jgi:hypothetical protein